MRMCLKKKIYLPLALAAIIYLSSCQQPGGNVTGSEYMPDMAHSIAYEANYYTYYFLNTWGSTDEYYEYAKPKLPVKGTIARGYVGNINANYTSPASGQTPNGSVSYYYGDTEEERTRAIEEIINNPYPITENGLQRGETLYDVYCGICHGENGDGLGYLARDANPVTGDAGGKFPVQPANMLLDEFIAASNGRFYHSIMYGKNMMGSYAGKLSYEERWQVIHYIRSLQAESKDLVYDHLENTLNDIDIPGGIAAKEEVQQEASQDHENQHDTEQSDH